MRTLMISSGVLLTVLMLASILIPWWKQRRHLLSYWSFFIMGSMVFISMSLAQNAAVLSSGHEFGSEALVFIAATFIFYGLASLVYFKPMRGRAPSRPVQWWPTDTGHSLVVAAIIFGTIGPLVPLIPPFPGAQLFYVTNAAMSILAFTLLLIYLVRNPGSLFAYLILAVVFAAGLVNVLTFGGGRRELLALMAAIPVTAYWKYFRHRPPGRTLVGIVAVASIGILVVTSYTSVRHADRDMAGGTARAVERIKQLPSAMADQLTSLRFFGGQGAVFDGQNAVWAGMLTIALTETDGTLQRDYFATPKFVLLNPIPRSLWPSKPEGLGKILPVAMGEHVVNWGPSIIGHAFYDGGWPMIIIYGLGLGLIMRHLDRAMLMDPDNPWLIALQCSIIGHVIGFSRGDCGVLGINILGTMVVLAAMILMLRPALGARPHHGSLPA